MAWPYLVPFLNRRSYKVPCPLDLVVPSPCSPLIAVPCRQIPQCRRSHRPAPYSQASCYLLLRCKIRYTSLRRLYLHRGNKTRPAMPVERGKSSVIGCRARRSVNTVSPRTTLAPISSSKPPARRSEHPRPGDGNYHLPIPVHRLLTLSRMVLLP